MIGKAKAIAHGHNAVRYMTGESANKKHPDKIFHLYSNLMPEGLDSTGIWQVIQNTVARYPRHIKNSVISLVLSPEKQHTKDFSMQDWTDLLKEYLAEFDKLAIYTNDDKVISRPTNLTNSKLESCLHFESESEIPHIHVAVCRIDKDGNLNNDHYIHLRAIWAAQAVDLKRGWKTAEEIHAERVKMVADDCYDVLRDMKQFDLADYFKRIEKKGYSVTARQDSKGEVRGYALILNRCRFKASELSRGLTVSRLCSTWQTLHNEKQKQEQAKRKFQPTTTTPVVTPASKHKRPSEEVQKPKPQPVVKPRDYTKYVPGTAEYRFTGTDNRCFIPEAVLELFETEFDSYEVSNWHTLQDCAVNLFVGYLDAATSIETSGGGGGSSDQSPWDGRKDDEDDLAFARRCVAQAKFIHPVRKKGMSR
ncbi:MAG: relaxase [Bacteroidales bacterium]|nr:relaxase [Bacteroidales bacterium]